jgi:hypothetical protein
VCGLRGSRTWRCALDAGRWLSRHTCESTILPSLITPTLMHAGVNPRLKGINCAHCSIGNSKAAVLHYAIDLCR